VDVPEVRFARSGDVNVAYGVVGDGPFDLVFVNGWVLSNLAEQAWAGPPATFFEQLSRFCRLILFDKRGTGLSDRVGGVPDLETRMDDVRAVMDAVGSKRAAIVGFSEAGPLSLLFAATCPERVAALVLFGTGASNVWAEDYPWGLTPAQREEELRQTEGVGSRKWLDAVLRVFAPSTATDEAAKQWWRRWVLASASPGTVLALRRMNSELDARHTLPAIHVPTLVLHRTGDETNPPDEGRYIADRIPGAEFVELAGSDHAFWVDPDQIVGEVDRFVRPIRERGEWELFEPERVLATVLFTDLAGSTEKLAELGDRRWRELLSEHHARVRRQLARYSGRELDTAGDGFFAAFDGPARAIRCACAIVDSVRDLGLEVRAGLHTGECEQLDGKVGGIAVHIGARVAAAARPGEVIVSRTVKDLVAGSEIAFEDRGSAELKGVPGAWELFAVVGIG
jgi:pimeloyl-ACP methyl ester carboxylesterase